ncbi:hypothetical protein LIER_21645 [Lithospermum erythrorhizon]|uniref:Galactose oxidase n=1 Tax=Lithospermum erythrorhizon TaxID=34254 RepID=A0AAV3QQX2_LITER
MILALLMLLVAAWGKNMEVEAGGGKWELLIGNIGISAMHMQLLNNDKVIIYDRTSFGLSNITLPDGKCRNNIKNESITHDCTAHSVEYDVVSNKIRALMVQTDTWCSSGSVYPDGSLSVTGGDGVGEDVVRIMGTCGGCDWREIEHGLSTRRWYSSNLFLPQGRQIVIGGRQRPSFEFYPKAKGEIGAYDFPFLRQTSDKHDENNLYPFVFLNVDGNLFIFANNRSILFDYKTRKVVRTYPDVPGGDPRNYPSTGSAVLLPLKNLEAGVVEAQVLVCGGAPRGSFDKSNAKRGKEFIRALDTCARISINDPNPQWALETMPMARVMNDMIMLPNGHVLLINGASNGTAGWENGREPVLHPVIYNPDSQRGQRFEVQNPTQIPRMYHSTAGLLRDGRVIVGGSNPHFKYVFDKVYYPTELSVEAFSPPYLEPEFARLRPVVVQPFSHSQFSYKQKTKIGFTVPGRVNLDLIKVTMLFPPFNTHSFSMNQRLMVLDKENVGIVGRGKYEVNVTTPGSPNLAPPGYYMLFVVHQNIPSEGVWMKIQ